jgi:hypothetical protein
MRFYTDSASQGVIDAISCVFVLTGGVRTLLALAGYLLVDHPGFGVERVAPCTFPARLSDLVKAVIYLLSQIPADSLKFPVDFSWRIDIPKA